MPLHFVHGLCLPARKRYALALLAACLCVFAALSWPSPALAHASLIANDPPNDAVLAKAPSQAHLTFDEPVSPLVFKLALPDGAVVDLRQIRRDQNSLMIGLPKLTQQGTYALSWRVISEDGHPVGGSQLFSVGTASHIGSSPHAAILRDILIWIARLAWLTGLIAGVGMAVFQVLSHAPRQSPPATERWMLTAGALAALASLGLLGVDAMDAQLSGLFGTAVWRTALTTSFAPSVALSWAALGLAALAWRASPAAARNLLALAALAALGLTLASSGHASTAPPVWLARPTVWLHVVAATAWVGLLIPLAHALGASLDLAALRRFSRIIPWILLLLIASGAGLVWLQFDHPASLWQTAYGRVLSAKLALVAVLLALGAHNRFRLTGRVLAGDGAARRAIRKTIAAECLFALLVLAVISLWRFTPPPRAIDAARATASSSVSVHIHTDEAMAQVVLDAHAGTQTMTMYLFGDDMAPLRAREVSVVFSDEKAGVEPIRYAAHPAPDGTWRVEAIRLPRLANWHLEIDVLISDFDRIRLQTQLDAAP